MPPAPNKNTPNDPADTPRPEPSVPDTINSQPPIATKQRRRGRLSFLILLLVWAGLLGLIIVNRQNLSDWWRLRGYQPPATIAQLADQDTMNSYAKHLFYLNRPQLLSSVSSFRQHCPENKDTIVLGCYRPEQAGIFVYNVKDPSLQGIAQVTAAHEVLHAIYGRLSTKDRSYVDGLLNNYYKNGLTDNHVRDEIKLYQKTEPNDVTNEMHSVFGTEIASLPAPLEAYYKRYFTDRSAIVAYQNQYEDEFVTRQNAISRDDQQLAVMKQQITNQQTDLNSQLTKLSSQRAQLDSLRANGNATAYNSQVSAYNAQVNTYNNGVTNLQAAISQYNQLVTARNLVAGELTTLDKAVDTRLMTQATN